MKIAATLTQAVLDWGGDIYLPAGLYEFSDPLIVRDGTTLHGEGMKRTLLRYVGPGAALTAERGAEVRIALRDFRLESRDTGTETAPTVGIHLSGNYYCHVEHVQVWGGLHYGFTRAGILVGGDTPEDASKLCVLRDCHVQQCAGSGVEVAMESSVSLYDGRYHFNLEHGINAPGDGGRVSGLAAYRVVVEGNVAEQVLANSLHASLFSGCHFENSADSTLPLVILGDHQGACQGVTFSACGFGALAASYCVYGYPGGYNTGFVFTANEFAMTPGVAIACLGMFKMRGSFFASNVRPQTVPLLQNLDALNCNKWYFDPFAGQNADVTTIRPQWGRRRSE